MRKGRPGVSGVKGGLWSGSKFTNLTPYDPFCSQTDHLLKVHSNELNGNGVFFKQYEPRTGLIHVLSIEDIKDFIDDLPQEFVAGLNGLFLCPGSQKQLRSRWAFSYGVYYRRERVIFLFPFTQGMSIHFKSKPKPSICNEYERHGAKWYQDNDGWRIQFDRESLRSFYLTDVLMHEIGHHVDNMASFKGVNYQERERFAEWFSLEFGVKGMPTEKTEFGKTLQRLLTAPNLDDEKEPLTVDPQ